MKNNQFLKSHLFCPVKVAICRTQSLPALPVYLLFKENIRVSFDALYIHTDIKNTLLNLVGGKAGMIWENNIETYTLSYLK